MIWAVFLSSRDLRIYKQVGYNPSPSGNLRLPVYHDLSVHICVLHQNRVIIQGCLDLVTTKVATQTRDASFAITARVGIASHKVTGWPHVDISPMQTSKTLHKVSQRHIMLRPTIIKSRLTAHTYEDQEWLGNNWHTQTFHVSMAPSPILEVFFAHHPIHLLCD